MRSKTKGLDGAVKKAASSIAAFEKAIRPWRKTFSML